MQCPNCDYEIEKPNTKKCPLCGERLTPVQRPTADAHTVPPAPHPAPEAVEETTANLGQPEIVECPVCRTRIPGESNFCPRCGHNMHEEVQTQEHEEPEQPKATEASKQPETPKEPEQPETHKGLEQPETPLEPELTSAPPTDDIPDAVIERDEPHPTSAPIEAATPAKEIIYVREEEDEDIDNGSYQPYPGEDPVTDDPASGDNTPPSHGTDASPIAIPTWIIITIAAVASIAIGAALNAIL